MYDILLKYGIYRSKIDTVGPFCNWILYICHADQKQAYLSLTISYAYYQNKNRFEVSRRLFQIL